MTRPSIYLTGGLVAVSLFLAACEQKTTDQDDLKNQDLNSQAMRIAQETIIADTHIDVPYRLEKKWEDVSKGTDGGDFDYPRAVKGGLNAPFMSIYTPAKYDGSEQATSHAHRMIDLVEKMVATAPEKFTIAKTVADMKTAFDQGKIALPLGMENGSPINGKLDNLQAFYDRGIRYITLAHSKSNHISDSSYDKNRHYETGLSPFGEGLIHEMNKLGIMVDISHVSDKAFYRAVELSKVPVIASHSSARHFTPGFERNMSDDMIKKLAETGGIIMINYGSSFVTKEANGYSAKMAADYQTYLTAQSENDTPEIKAAFEEKWKAENPYPFASRDQVLDHIDHVVQLTGSADFVGIGSDYDGVGDSLPTGLKDVASYPNLIKGLLERGYSEADIKKILSGNLIRVWSQVEAYASQ